MRRLDWATYFACTNPGENQQFCEAADMNDVKVFVILIAVVSSHVSLKAQDCDLLRQSTRVQLINYLQSNSRSEPEWPCIKFALRELGESKGKEAKEAIPVLVDYLDYKRPLSGAEKNGFFLHMPSAEEMYPATGALFSIGQPAIPAMIRVIESSDDPQKHDNAVFVIMQIYRERMPQGIQKLKAASAARAEKGFKLEAQRLNQSAKEALRWCTVNRSECEQALGNDD